MTTGRTVGFTIAKLIGTFELSVGIYGVLSPLSFTHFYGLPDAGTDHAVLARGLGARNMAVALSSLTLSFTEQRKPLALLLGAYTLAGISDIWICAHHGNKLPEHIIGTILLATASYLLAR